MGARNGIWGSSKKTECLAFLTETLNLIRYFIDLYWYFIDLTTSLATVSHGQIGQIQIQCDIFLNCKHKHIS